MSNSAKKGLDREEILRRARRGEPYPSVAEDMGCSHQNISAICRRAGIERGSASESDHPKWRPVGSERLDGDGYVEEKVECEGGGYAWRPQHRVVMERTLGRPLSPDEVVHHKNGDKTDNRPENLEVMGVGEHTSLHRTQEHERNKAKRGRDVRVLRALAEKHGRVPTTGELCDVLGKAYTSVASRWREPSDERPYADATARLYERAGMDKRKTGTPGHVSNDSV